MKEKRKKDYVCNSCGKESRVYNDVNTCPKCGAKYWNKPKNEQRLLTLQDLYRETLNEGYFSKMIGHAMILTRNIIVNKLKRSGKFISDEELEDMTHETIEKLIFYYRNKPDFHISESFNGYIQQMVLQPMYSKKKQDKEQNEVSINAPVTTEGNREITIEEAFLEEKPTIEFSEDWMMDNIQEDLQIKAIMDFIEGAFLYYFKRKNDLIYPLRLLNMIRLEIQYQDEFWKANAQDSYRSEILAKDTKNLHSLLHDFIKAEVVDERAFMSLIEYYGMLEEQDKKKKEEREAKKYKKAKTYQEMLVNMMERGKP